MEIICKLKIVELGLGCSFKGCVCIFGGKKVIYSFQGHLNESLEKNFSNSFISFYWM